MATIPNQTATLKLRDDSWYGLGRSRVVAGSVRCATLTEGKDFEVDYEFGRIHRLRELAAGSYTITYDCSDRVDELAGTDSAKTLVSLKTQYDWADGRLAAMIAGGGTFTAQQVRDAMVDQARILQVILHLQKDRL